MKENSAERTERLRKLLLAEKRRLWEELRREVFEKVGEELHGQYDFPQDPGERSLLDVLEDTGLALADLRRQELTRLEAALQRLTDGRYGVCEECGAEIDEQRLRLVPYAARCVACQATHEGPATGPGRTL